MESNWRWTADTMGHEFAIATANRLKLAFVVITGDLINKGGDTAQGLPSSSGLSAKLDPKIQLFGIPGNHDVGNEPTAESLAQYRERFGKDYYWTTPSTSETSPLMYPTTRKR